MSEWLNRNWGDIIMVFLLLAAVTAILVSLLRKKRSGECACGCSGCGGKCSSRQPRERDRFSNRE